MVKSNNEKIDIVLLWVDGNDEAWLEEKRKYQDISSGVNRFRDCDNMQYLFRGIEKYAPWINKIFFITWGHVPKWLDTTNEKLVIINHKEYIPHEYLPTYNSNVIELNIHRIEELSEKFILFNDDLFIIKPTEPTDFFQDDLPRDTFLQAPASVEHYNDNFFFMRANIAALLRKYFNQDEVNKNNLSKIINPCYEDNGNLKAMEFPQLFGWLKSFHGPQPYLKSTFKEVWDKEYKNLHLACHNKFRAHTDLGHYLMRGWHLLEGKFVPKKNENEYLVLKDDNSRTMAIIEKQQFKTICINDAFPDIDFNKAINEINSSFAKLFPDKSSFELNNQEGNKKC